MPTANTGNTVYSSLPPSSKKAGTQAALLLAKNKEDFTYRIVNDKVTITFDGGKVVDIEATHRMGYNGVYMRHNDVATLWSQVSKIHQTGQQAASLYPNLEQRSHRIGIQAVQVLAQKHLEFDYSVVNDVVTITVDPLSATTLGTRVLTINAGHSIVYNSVVMRLDSANTILNQIGIVT